MNTLELVTHLRKNILDDYGGVGVEWESFSSQDFDSIQLRWDNEELVANINEAITQVYRRINPIKDLETLEVTTGETEYPLPSYIQNILIVRREDKTQLEEKELIDIWWDSSTEESIGDLVSYSPDYRNKVLKFSPVPVKDEVVSMMVYRYAKTKLSWEDPEASPELIEQFQLPMLWYAAFLCYSKDEANTLDPKRAATMLSYFDREFPFTSAYSNMRKSRTSNKGIKYGGQSMSTFSPSSSRGRRR
jgi:hypothetical protein